MSRTDQEIRRGLERLSDPAETSEPPTFDQLVARRRHRRRRNTVLALLPIVVVVGVVVGLISFGSDEGTTVTADGGGDGSPPTAANPTVSVERTEVVGGDGGTTRVVIDFDGPLPGRDIRYVADIASLDPGDEIVYTTQDATRVRVCESVHSFPPPAEGTVDLLIPADWFADGEDAHTGPLETRANPAKFVVCGPHEGFFQYSIWGPVSADVANVDVAIDTDGRRLTVDIRSGAESTTTTTALPGIDQADAEAAASLVSDFLDDLRRRDLAAAAERWTGYPMVGLGTQPAERIPFIERLLVDPAFARILEGDTETFVSASWGRTGAAPVVTVLAPRDGDDPPVAVAFLAGFTEEQGDPGTMWIHRLPLDDTAPDIAGSFVEPGQQIVIPGVPVEGGARAYIGEREIPVEVDHMNLTMVITIPDDVVVVEGDVAITVSDATPELPGVQAFAVTVRSP